MPLSRVEPIGEFSGRGRNHVFLRKGRHRNLFHLEQKVALGCAAEVAGVTWSVRVKGR